MGFSDDDDDDDDEAILPCAKKCSPENPPFEKRERKILNQVFHSKEKEKRKKTGQDKKTHKNVRRERAPLANTSPDFPHLQTRWCQMAVGSSPSASNIKKNPCQFRANVSWVSPAGAEPFF